MRPIALIAPLYLAAVAVAASTCPQWTFPSDPTDLRVLMRSLLERLRMLPGALKNDVQAARILEAAAMFQGLTSVTTTLSGHIGDVFANLGNSTETPICAPDDKACLDGVATGINEFCKLMYDPETKPASGLLGELQNALAYFGHKDYAIWVCKPMAGYIQALSDMFGKWAGPVSSRLSGPAKEAVIKCLDRVRRQATVVADKYRNTN